jgi:hypothetical protein
MSSLTVLRAVVQELALLNPRVGVVEDHIDPPSVDGGLVPLHDTAGQQRKGVGVIEPQGPPPRGRVVAEESVPEGGVLVAGVQRRASPQSHLLPHQALRSVVRDVALHHCDVLIVGV